MYTIGDLYGAKLVNQNEGKVTKSGHALPSVELEKYPQ